MAFLIINRRTVLLWLAAFLSSCGRRSNRQVAVFRIDVRPTNIISVPLRNANFPADPIIVLRQSKGYLRMQDVIDAFDGVTIDLEITDDVGKLHVFEIGRKFSDNAGSYCAWREDHTIDFAARLMMSPTKNPAIKVKINDSKNSLNYPISVAFEKLNEFP